MTRPTDDLSREERAIAARAELGEDFFGGWAPSDRALFQKYAAEGAAQPGKIVDFMGIVTSADFHPWAKHLNGTRSTSLPIPDDGLRAEAIEYFATFDALERAPAGRFNMAELGSSYGPWSCVSAVLARRAGRTRPHITAVEASSYLYELIPRHLGENGIADDNCDIRLLRGAVAAERQTLYFPRVSNAGENGGQAVTANRQVDYVGRTVENEEVPGLVLQDIIDRVFDLVHIDIQGLEAKVLAGAIDLLGARVRAIFIGTHSRLIEGQLLELFHSHGWKLERERPTKFSYERDRPDVVGWTTRDGGQYWVNLQLEQ